MTLCDGCNLIVLATTPTADGRALMCDRCLQIADCEHLWVAEDFVPYCGRCAVGKWHPMTRTI